MSSFNTPKTPDSNALRAYASATPIHRNVSRRRRSDAAAATSGGKKKSSSTHAPAMTGVVYVVAFDVVVQVFTNNGSTLLEPQVLLKVGSSGGRGSYVDHSSTYDINAVYASLLDRLYYHRRFNDLLRGGAKDDLALPCLLRPQKTRSISDQRYERRKFEYFSGALFERERPDLAMRRVLSELCDESADGKHWRNVGALLFVNDATASSDDARTLVELEGVVRALCGWPMPPYMIEQLGDNTRHSASGTSEFVLVPRSFFDVLRAGFEELVRSYNSPPFVDVDQFMRFLVSIRNQYDVYYDAQVHFVRGDGTTLRLCTPILSSREKRLQPDLQSGLQLPTPTAAQPGASALTESARVAVGRHIYQSEASVRRKLMYDARSDRWVPIK